MGLFDVHAHMTDSKIQAREAEVLAAARAAGVTSIVSNGLNPNDNQAVLELSQRDSLVKPAFGLYPVDAVLPEMLAAGLNYPRETPEHTGTEAIEWVVKHIDSAFAVGEIGLDGHWVPKDFWELQDKHFRSMVALAQKHDRAIIIHTRRREKRTLEILDEMNATRVNWHCFGGKLSLAKEIVRREGHYFSIPSNVRRHEAFTRLLQTFPRERILLETDCPYLGREVGVDSEPSHVAATAEFASELWKEPLANVHEQLAKNFTALFGVEP